MRILQVLAGTLGVAVVSAHSEVGGVPGAPKLFGRRAIQDLRARGLLSNPKRPATGSQSVEKRSGLAERQVGGTSGQCGRGIGSCAAGYCCSSGGWCGNTEDYCLGPDCQFNYGSGCDMFKVPPGTTTSGVARPKVGNVPYGGAGIYDCTVPNMIALTFDDGPYIYTQQILNVLAQYKVPATFFITGNNLGKGEIDNAAYPWSGLIQQMHTAGHQIASHTWTHQDLGSSAASQGQEKLTQQQRLNQMYYNEMAFRNILGFFPTYMRPPYSDCDAASGCESDLANLGYHIVYFDLDTEDYLMDSPQLIQNSKNDFKGNVSSVNAQTSNWLVIGHDIHQQTAYNLTQYMITTAQSLGYKFGTVGDCLGDPQANWYRSAGGGGVVSTSTGAGGGTTTTSGTGTKPTAVSPDGSCGGTGGYTCLGSTFGNCCSQHGWCGATTDYCGTGCQANFGNCGSNSVTSKTSTTSTSKPPTTSSTTSKPPTTTSTTSEPPTTTSTTSKPSTTTTAPPKTSTTVKISPDATCGGVNGYTCQGSAFGNCCSQHGWCGSTTAYCGTGCQAAFGTCG